jgi:hypothetical protein
MAFKGNLSQNGTVPYPEKQTLRLSDAFEKMASLSWASAFRFLTSKYT